eukprot:7462443-Alexandrium_andersonii.AAC.1
MAPRAAVAPPSRRPSPAGGVPCSDKKAASRRSPAFAAISIATAPSVAPRRPRLRGRLAALRSLRSAPPCVLRG